MGESARKIGDKLEEFAGKYLLDNFGWKELTRDREIKCIKTAHKNPTGKGKRTHGIDLLCKYDDPYYNGQAIIIECKNYQMQSINASNVKAWLQELINNVDCASTASELKDIGIGDAQLITGLLLIHANDGAYNEDAIKTILSGLSITSRKKPINIFIATNREIFMWTSLFKRINEDFGNDEFVYVYPSVNNLNKVETKLLSIRALYSRYLFAQHNYKEDYNQNGITGGKVERKSSIMFSFDDVSADSFRYMWSMFKACQRQGHDYQKYIFYFYPKVGTDMNMLTTANFMNIIDQESQPLNATDKTKIELRIIDNRMLSPVDTLGGA